MGSGDDPDVVDGELFAQQQYCAIAHSQLQKLPARATVDFTLNAYSASSEGVMMGIGFGQAGDDGSSVGYFLLVDLADNQVALQKIAATVGSPDMDTTSYESLDLEWSEDVTCTLTLITNDDALQGVVSRDGSAVAELSGTDDTPLLQGAVGLNGGTTREIPARWDNLRIETCE